tara:strand:- start:509 stop:709 length:201 start_codon:yes stop_codon:yes gene_type:complete
MQFTKKGIIIVQKTPGESLNFYNHLNNEIEKLISDSKLKITQCEIEKIYNISKKKVSSKLLGCNYY